MTNTALRAENSNSRTITFKSREHEKFYEEYLKKCRYQDVYHRALVYCLGIDRDTRENVNKIYNFKTGCVKTESLQEGWQTSGSLRIVRMAFNLYCNGTPSVGDYEAEDESSLQRRLADFKKALSKNQVLEEFDRGIFESIIEKVIVGGYDENGEKDPYRIIFIYKTGFRNEIGNAKERFGKKSKAVETAKEMCSYIADEVKDVCSYGSDNTCGDCVPFGQTKTRCQGKNRH